MTLKYCRGSARLAETILGWSRAAVEVGLAEYRTGILCLGAQSACSGRKRWEEHAPEAAEALRQLAEAHAQQDPTFRTTSRIRASRRRPLGKRCGRKGSQRSNCPHPAPWRRC